MFDQSDQTDVSVPESLRRVARVMREEAARMAYSDPLTASWLEEIGFAILRESERLSPAAL